MQQKIREALCYSELLGQNRAKKILTAALATARIPHGYLFSGPQGVGKRLFARGMAAALTCLDTRRVGACGICNSCKKHRSGNHPDFLQIEPEKEAIKIDQIRQVIKETGYPPYEASTRVIVLRNIHTMRKEAANSLLKILEEPPPGNCFILTADSSEAILATLNSRCQKISFMPLSLEQTETILLGHGLTGEAASLLARLSQGSPGLALGYHQKEVVPLARAIVAAITLQELDESGGVGGLLELAGQMAETRDGFSLMVNLIRLAVRDLFFAEDYVEVSGLLTATAMARKSWSSEKLFATLQALDEAEAQHARNCNRSQIAEVLLFTLQDLLSGS